MVRHPDRRFLQRGCRAGESGTAHRPRRTGRSRRGRRKVARVHCLLRHGDGCRIRGAAAGRKSAYRNVPLPLDMPGIAAPAQRHGRSGGCCRGGVHAAAASREDAAGHRVPAGCGRTDAGGSAGADNSAGRSDDAMAADDRRRRRSASGAIRRRRSRSCWRCRTRGRRSGAIWRIRTAKQPYPPS